MPNKKRKSEASLINNTATDENNNDGDDDLPQVVNAPTPANGFIERLVAMLLQESDVVTVLDAFLGMELDEEEKFHICDAFKNTDICKNIINVIGIQDQTDEVVRKACNFITDLTYKDRGFFRQQFLANDCIQAITTQMTIFLQSEDLQKSCSLAIMYITSGAYEENSIIEVFKDDTLKILSDVMKKYPENIHIQNSIIGSIYQISHESEAMMDRVIQNNFVEYTLDALNTHFDNSSVSENSCEFLKLIVAKEEVRICIRAKDGIILLAKIESHYRKISEDKVADLAVNVLRGVCSS